MVVDVADLIVVHARVEATAPAQGPGKAIGIDAEQPQGALAPTTYSEPGMRITRSETAAPPYVLRRAPNATTRPRMRLNQATPLFRVTGRYWVVDGLELDLADQRTTGLVLEGRYIRLRRSYVHGRQSASIYVEGHSTQCSPPIPW